MENYYSLDEIINQIIFSWNKNNILSNILINNFFMEIREFQQQE